MAQHEPTPGGLQSPARPQPATARILFVTLSLDVGGAERHLAALLPALARRGWPVAIYCMNRLGAFADQARAAGVEVIGPPVERQPGVQGLGPRLFATTRAAARLHAVLRRLQPQIAHFFLPEAYLVGAPLALLHRVPVRIMSRRGRNHYQRQWPGAAAAERHLHRRMTAVLANSRRVAADLAAEGCLPERLGLIYNGVAVAGLDEPVDRAAVRAQLGVGPDDVLAIVVANLIPYKGHADILAAVAAIRDRMPAPLRLVCIGRDEGAGAALAAEARRLDLGGVVSFHGVRSDVAALLAASELAILASHEEGFSNAVIEAMAAGLALIVTDVGGNAEAVLHGETGLVVPPRSPAQLGDAILRLLADAALRRRLGEAGRARARAHFSLPACVDRYETLYRGLLAGRTVAELGLGVNGMPPG